MMSKHLKRSNQHDKDLRSNPQIGGSKGATIAGRRIETELDHAGEGSKAHKPERGARESEFTVSRGGLNQESDHNKHHDSGQSGHKPRTPGPGQEKH